MTDRIILGIDPGSNITGYGIIHLRNKSLQLVTAGVFDVSNEEDHFSKLQLIFRGVVKLIEDFHPDEFAVEEPFYGKNVQSMLKLGRAQGVAIAAALHRNLPVTGYSPRKVKQSVTGKGSASKEQVAEMVQRLLDFDKNLYFEDTTDALAVAVCHSFQGKGLSSGGSENYSGWKSFIQQNPERAL
ncbi:MAG: crossover junction endodeoxyribonuclease RuvC [Bacteroidota bacterium]